jgi:hypothetical protein
MGIFNFYEYLDSVFMGDKNEKFRKRHLSENNIVEVSKRSLPRLK